MRIINCRALKVESKLKLKGRIETSVIVPWWTRRACRFSIRWLTRQRTRVCH